MAHFHSGFYLKATSSGRPSLTAQSKSSALGHFLVHLTLLISLILATIQLGLISC